jgi:hypothetical protein
MMALLDPPVSPGFPYPASSQTQTPIGNYTYEGPTIAGVAMPGQWLLKKASRVFGWQKQVANFLSGATVVPSGDPPMDVEYEVRIWESGTMSAFIAVCGTLLKKPVISIGAALPVSAALGIDDSILKVLGVTTVVVAEVDFPKNPLVVSGGKGPWIGHVKFIEYRKGVAVLPVPDQSYPDTGAVTPGNVNFATAMGSVTAGASTLQATAATALVPPR